MCKVAILYLKDMNLSKFDNKMLLFSVDSFVRTIVIRYVDFIEDITNKN